MDFEGEHTNPPTPTLTAYKTHDREALKDMNTFIFSALPQNSTPNPTLTNYYHIKSQII